MNLLGIYRHTSKSKINTIVNVGCFLSTSLKEGLLLKPKLSHLTSSWEVNNVLPVLSHLITIGVNMFLKWDTGMLFSVSVLQRI